MPYITLEEREALHDHGEPVASSGQLNYSLTIAIDDFLSMNGVSYETLNAAIGVLECAKLELYRRIAAPYEDSKLRKNGDVYLCADSRIGWT